MKDFLSFLIPILMLQYPANNMLAVQFDVPLISLPQNIRIIGASGETIYQLVSLSGSPNNTQFSVKLPDLPAGLYLLQLWNNGNNYSGKIIIN